MKEVPTEARSHHRVMAAMKKDIIDIYPTAAVFSARNPEEPDIVDAVGWSGEQKEERFWEILMLSFLHPELKTVTFTLDSYIKNISKEEYDQGLAPLSEDPEATEALITHWFIFDEGSKLVDWGSYTEPYRFIEGVGMEYMEPTILTPEENIESWLNDMARNAGIYANMTGKVGRLKEKYQLKELIGDVNDILSGRGHSLMFSEYFMKEYL